MRIIILMTLFLSSMSAFSSIILNYTGAIYPSEQIEDCRQDFEQIATRVESLEGFTIIQGGCAYYSPQKLQIRFSYVRPLTNALERTTRVYTSTEQCLSVKNEAQINFDRAHLKFVDSFCNGPVLTITFAGHKGYFLNLISNPIFFASLRQCEQYILDITSAFNAYEVYPLLSTCNAIVNPSSQRTEYQVSLSYSQHYSKKIKMIRGEEFENITDCSRNQSYHRDNFKKAKVDLVHNFCAHSQGNEKFVEFIIYIQGNNSPFVKDLEGNSSANKEECQITLEQMASKLSTLGHKELYRYCRKNFTKIYTPVLYYSENRSL